MTFLVNPEKLGHLDLPFRPVFRGVFVGGLELGGFLFAFFLVGLGEV